MELKSCLYETEIMHHRLSPKEHRFSYKFFSFYLDLDEINGLTKRILFLSRNKFNLYSFFDRDHIEKDGHPVKESVLSYLNEKGINLAGGRIMLLTYLRTFGYVFNPVSFYFCFDKNDRPVCVIPEIGNTFGELKPFLIRRDQLNGRKFKDSQDKFYYISPFARLDDQLDFKLTIPGEKLNICIDTSRRGKKLILTTMLGHQEPLSNRTLGWLTLKFPLVTLKVISLIHWHAFLLWMKKIPYEEKTSNIHLQKEVQRVWNKDDRKTRNRYGAEKVKYIPENH